MITSWPLNVVSASSAPPYMIDCHQPALHESSKVNSPCHIPTVASKLTDENRLSTRRRAVHPPPASTHPTALDYGLQFELSSALRGSPNWHNYGLQSRLITVSKFAWPWPPSAYLQTRSNRASKCISKLSQLWPPKPLYHTVQVYLQTCSITAINCISKLTRTRSRSASRCSLAQGLQVYHQTSSITASECISKLAASRTQSSLDRHCQAPFELLSRTACNQSRHTVYRWVAL